MPATIIESSPENSPTFEPPTYTITVGSDNSLQWDPPPKSRKLGLALSYHFPEEASTVCKMQAAIRQWLMHQPREPIETTNGSTNLTYTPHMTRTASRVESEPICFETAACLYQEVENKRGVVVGGSEILPPRKRSKIPGSFTWRLGLGNGVEMEPTVRSKEERAEIRRNRGRVCDYHRWRKQRCRPTSCPQNKLHDGREPLVSAHAPKQLSQEENSDGILNDTFKEFFVALPSQCPQTPSCPLSPKGNSSLGLATAKDTIDRHGQMASHPMSGSTEGRASFFHDESVLIAGNLTLFELDLKAGPQPIMPLLNDQTASQGGLRPEQRPDTLPSQSSSAGADLPSSRNNMIISPFFEIPKMGADFAHDSRAGFSLPDAGTLIEDSYHSLWSPGIDSFYLFQEHFLGNPTCSYEICLPLPISFLAGTWNQKYDEPLWSRAPVHLDSIRRKDEDTRVNDLGAITLMPCDTCESIQVLYAYEHDLKRGRCSSIQDSGPGLELGLERLSSALLDTGYDFMHLWVMKFHMFSFSV